jgi:hypothetical protein
MQMAKVKITANSKAAAYQGWLDYRQLTFRDDTVELDVAGGMHLLQWAIAGAELQTIEFLIEVEGRPDTKATDQIPERESATIGMWGFNV